MRIEKHVCIRTLVLLIALAIAGVFSWMVGTNDGARFVLEKVSRSIPADTRIGEVKGRIAGNLEIADIRITTPTRLISVEKLRVRWNPLSALTGWIYIKSIVLDRLVINNLQPNVQTPIDLTWPRISGLLSWLKIRTRGLRINGVSFRDVGSEVQRIDTVGAQVTWYLGGLNVDDLRIEGPPGTLEGTIGASFIDPLFVANTKIRPRQTFYDLDELAVMLKVQKGGGREGLSGMISLIGMSGKNEQIKFSGPLYFTGSEIIFTGMQFREMGRRGAISVTGRANLGSLERTYAADITLDGLGIFKDPAIETALSGAIRVAGSSSGYRGTVDLTNKGESWKEIDMEGVFHGNREKISLDGLKGRVLGGTVDGSLRVSWVKGMQLSWDVATRGLNPERITREWPGTVNADIQGDLTWSGVNELNGIINAKLLKSTVRKRPLTGFMEARWSKGFLTLSDCELHGNGFDISARGSLTSRITYRARVSDLSGLLPSSRGRFSAVGWLRRDKATWSGTADVEGNDILIGNVKIGSTTFHAGINDRGIDSLKMKARARTVIYGAFGVDTAEISVAGKTRNHELLINAGWPRTSVTVEGSGGYSGGTWTGKINRIDGRDRYSGTFSLAKAFAASVSGRHILVSPLVVRGADGEAIEMEADLGLTEGSHATTQGGDPDGIPTGHARLRWDGLNLARFTPFLGSGKVEGRSSGLVELERTDKKHARMSGTGSAVISATRGPIKLVITGAKAALTWDNRGLKTNCEILLQDGGRLDGQFSSIESAEFRWPSSGEMRAAWQDVDVSFIQTWFPAGLEMKGKLSGRAAGKLLGDSRFELSGRTAVAGGVVTWKSEAGAIQAMAEKAGAEFVWNKSTIQGVVNARFPSHGSMQSTFRIPLPARFPVRMDKSGPTHMTARGDMQEKGIVSAMFPGLVEESKGKLSFDVARAGPWGAPDVQGRIRLESAGAYLPSAGIRVKDVGFEALLGKDRINIASFRSRSGPGEIDGSCTLWLKGWGVSRFKGSVRGNRFQIAYLPEFQALANPDLAFEGDGKMVAVNGSVVIPEALVRDGGGKDVVRASDDLIVIDRPQKAKKSTMMNIDGRILVVLGKKVRIQLAGLDGRMEGRVQLTGQSPGKVLGKGQLKIVQGKFSSYGVKLDIVRGNIIFDDKPVEQASVDVMALRTFNPGRFTEVKAGVTVGGTPSEPLVKLYSEPAMSDTDILSYIVFGTPLTPGETGNQTATLIKSAGSLLGGKRSAGLQDEIRERFGLDTLDVQEESGSAFVGARSGAAATGGTGTLDRSLVTVGKYLSPRLYVAYGRSVFTDEYLVTVRYNLARRLEIESRTGIHRSVDLYYKIEFD
jgi:translocation and assembly module TamB